MNIATDAGEGGSQEPRRRPKTAPSTNDENASSIEAIVINDVSQFCCLQGFPSNSQFNQNVNKNSSADWPVCNLRGKTIKTKKIWKFSNIVKKRLQ